MRLGAVLTVVGTVLNLLLTDPGAPVADSGFGRANDTINDGTVQAIGYSSAAFTVLLGVGLWLWMAWANGKGKAWARTLATVLGCMYGGFWVLGLAAVAILDAELGAQPRAARLIGSSVGLVTLLVGSYALWLMYRPESSAFYAASSLPPPPAGWPAHYPPAYPYQYPRQAPPPPPAGSSGR
jgi:hypothetical protein